MGLTLDVLRGRVSVYLTCDNCGAPILGRAACEPLGTHREVDRYTHADGCPENDSAPDVGDDESSVRF
jgi:hypothetical protein